MKFLLSVLKSDRELQLVATIYEINTENVAKGTCTALFTSTFHKYLLKIIVIPLSFMYSAFLHNAQCE